ncbi:DoxX family protein [Ekhidna sp. MALMAid0563]|uniref:DoxX family protein n=1 Tax=Ekhidna sp. MALMAid0563 TaxID=3143937 RepID=UPI0032DFFA17
MKTNKILYWLFTGLLCAMMLFQTFFSFAQTETLAEMYEDLGFSGALVIPLGIAKFLAVLAILTKRSPLLKKLAYYGLGIDFVLALYAHLSTGDPNWPGPVVAIVLLTGSMYFDKKLYSSK